MFDLLAAIGTAAVAFLACVWVLAFLALAVIRPSRSDLEDWDSIEDWSHDRQRAEAERN